jgi:hypothetical protein
VPAPSLSTPKELCHAVPQEHHPPRKPAAHHRRSALLVASLGWLGFTPLGLVLAASGATGIVTGLFGYCPACAMVGRKPVE